MNNIIIKAKLRLSFLVAFSYHRNQRLLKSKYQIASEIQNINTKDLPSVKTFNSGLSEEYKYNKFEELTTKLKVQRNTENKLKEAKRKISLSKEKNPKKDGNNFLDKVSSVPFKALWMTILSAIILLIAAILFYLNIQKEPVTSSNMDSTFSTSTVSTNTSGVSTKQTSPTLTSSSVTTQQTLSTSSTTPDLKISNEDENFSEIVEITLDEVTKNPFGIQVDKIHKLPSTYIPTDLITSNEFSNVRLKKEVLTVLKLLFEDANSKNIKMKVISSFRSYETQKMIFDSYVQSEMITNNKTEAEAKIIANKYSALPGHSEHQLGTTIDVICELCKDFEFSEENLKVWKYLEDNAPKFGFKISYPKNNLAGYDYEPWHIRYYGI
jgi:D-alanyl-D-alanine carboxypeptidase